MIGVRSQIEQQNPKPLIVFPQKKPCHGQGFLNLIQPECSSNLGIYAFRCIRSISDFFFLAKASAFFSPQ